MRAPIHSIKHYHQMTLTSVTLGSTTSNLLVSGVELLSVNQNNEVIEGAIVKAVYVELWLLGLTNNQFFTVILEKTPNASAPATIANMADLGGYANKKNILYTTQGLAPNDGVGQPVPVIRQWFKIPKGKQRFALGDNLRLNVASRGDGTIDFCGFATYKEYT